MDMSFPVFQGPSPLRLNIKGQEKKREKHDSGNGDDDDDDGGAHLLWIATPGERIGAL